MNWEAYGIPLASAIISVTAFLFSVFSWYAKSRRDHSTDVEKRLREVEEQWKMSEAHRLQCEKDLFIVMRKLVSLEEKTNIESVAAAGARSTVREFMDQIGVAAGRASTALPKEEPRG